MFFKFLNYISPTWYFNLEPQNKNVPYCVDYGLLNDDEKSVIHFDTNYSSAYISKLDAAYQAWHKGIIKTDRKFNLQASSEKTKLTDEYYFIRKYYKSFWAVYIFMIRVLSFHNPLHEFSAFYKTRRRVKTAVYDPVTFHAAYKNFTRHLLI